MSRMGAAARGGHQAVVPPRVRVRVLTGLLWCLIGLGPALGAAALLRQAPPEPPDAEQPPPGVTGLAELAVAAHLGSAGRSVDQWLEPAAVGFRPAESTADALSTAEREADVTARASTPTHVATVATTAAGPGRWGVTVAVVDDDTMLTYQVTVAHALDGPLIETRPVLVAPPTTTTFPTPALPPLRVPTDDVVADAVAGFAQAYLTGAVDLDRYLTPTSQVVALPHPVRQADVLRLATAPYGESRATALAEVQTISQDGRVAVMHLPLLLESAGGRWEVRRILPALPLGDPPTGNQARIQPTERQAS